MRKASIALAAAALVLAGCGGGSEEADDTPAPAASPTTAMSGDHAGHGGGEGASCSPSGTAVNVVASGTRFNTDCLAAPANQQFTFSFENKDSIGHNIVFLESHTATETMFRVDVFRGPATQTFTVGPFRPGNYAFHCEVHPSTMQGTFVVK